jgi:hypothetical protein
MTDDTTKGDDHLEYVSGKGSPCASSQRSPNSRHSPNVGQRVGQR